MLSKKNKLFLYALLLIIPLFTHISIVSAIGINGVDITSDGKIKVDTDSSITMGDDNAGVNETLKKQMNEFLNQRKWEVSFFMGLCTLSMLFIWLYKIFQFAKSGSEASERKKAMSSLITLGIATAMLTGATFFITFATGLLNI